MSPATAVTTVTVFVDWNSQICILGLSEHKEEPWFVEIMFERLFRRISRALDSVGVGGNRKLVLRLYYGWFKGFEQQVSRKRVSAFVASHAFSSVAQSQNAIVSRVEFGDRLLSATDARLHGRLQIHLPNTFRNGIGPNKPPYEKMVDTALASDFLVWGFGVADAIGPICDSDCALVMAEDDDLWPPLLAAEPFWVRRGASAFVVQRNLPSADMPRVSGLVINM